MNAYRIDGKGGKKVRGGETFTSNGYIVTHKVGRPVTVKPGTSFVFLSTAEMSFFE